MRMTPEEFLARFPQHPVAKDLQAQGVQADATGADGARHRKKGKARKAAANVGPSHLEALFEQHLLAMKAPPTQREHRFHPERGWRMDFAWPEYRVAVEVEGGVWGMGRHNRPRGFIADTEKYNAAAELGWIVLRFTGQAIKSGKAIEQTLDVLKERESLRAQFEPDPRTPSIMRPRSRPRA